MKTWDGDLSHLKEEDMQLFSAFYVQFQYGTYSDLFIKTKKQVKEAVARWNESGWSNDVVEICEFMLLERMERHRRARISWEKRLYRKLKRKFERPSPRSG